MSARAKVTTGYTPWYGSSTDTTRSNNENIRDLKNSLSIDFDPPTFTSGVAEIWGCSFSPSLDIAGSPGTLGTYWATGANQYICVAYKFNNVVDATTGELVTQNITQTFATKWLADTTTAPWPTFGNSSPTNVINGLTWDISFTTVMNRTTGAQATMSYGGSAGTPLPEMDWLLSKSDFDFAQGGIFYKADLFTDDIRI